MNAKIRMTNDGLIPADSPSPGPDPHSSFAIRHSIAIANRHPRLRFRRAEVARALRVLDDGHSALRLPRSAIPPGELSIVFLTDPALAKLHAGFMDDPAPTDVITFEGDPAAGTAGEICVSADTAARVAGLPSAAALARRPKPWRRMERSDTAATLSSRRAGLERGCSREPRLAGTRALQNAFAAELTLYLVHGWLHLAGHDDLMPAGKRRMRAAERRALGLLRKHAAIPAFRLG